MGVADNQLLEVVTKLIQLTQEDQIKWTTLEPTQPEGRDDLRFGTLFFTNYKGKKLRLYKVNSKQDVLPFMKAFTIAAGNKDGKTWVGQIHLEFLDDKNQVTWAFPYIKSLDDLHEAASYQIAGVFDFINEILGDSQPKKPSNA